MACDGCGKGPTIEVIIPYKPAPDRKPLFEWVANTLLSRGFLWVVGRMHEKGNWSKGAVVSKVVRTCDADIVVVHDADVWSPGLSQAISAVREGAPWAVPHGKVYRLNEKGTKDYMASGEFDDSQLDRPAYIGYFGGGITVLPRETYLDCPLDPRFTGWGGEDMAWGEALTTLHGKPWRGDAPCIHLHHEPSAFMTNYGNEANGKLYFRYHNAMNDAAAMRELVREHTCP